MFNNFRAKSEKLSQSKLHVCYVCSKTFSLKKYLKRHMKVHNGKRTFSCQRCAKSFLRQASLIRHTRIHTGEKPHRCSECTMSFTYLLVTCWDDSIASSRSIAEPLRTARGRPVDRCSLLLISWGHPPVSLGNAWV